MHPPDIKGTLPCQRRLTATAHVRHKTPLDAHHLEVIHKVPYCQQIKTVSTSHIEPNRRSKPLHLDLPKQEPFCTPEGKAAPVDENHFVKTLQSKLWILVHEREAFGRIETVYFVGTESPMPWWTSKGKYWDARGKTNLGKNYGDPYHIPSVWIMHRRWHSWYNSAHTVLYIFYIPPALNRCAEFMIHSRNP